MPTKTQNIDLNILAQDEFFDVEDFNNYNMRKIDEVVKKIQDIVKVVQDTMVNKTHKGDVLITSNNGLSTIAVNSSGFSFYSGSTVNENNLIFRVDGGAITFKKAILVNGKNIETELTNRFTKTESDNRYYQKAQVYTKTETDARYYQKTQVYTKTETDGMYRLKTDSYGKSEVYNKGETDGKIATAKTDVTNAYKAADTVITNKAQLSKITKDNGESYYIGGGSANYASCTAMIKDAPAGMFAVRIEPNAADSPDVTKYWEGVFFKPTISGGYFMVQEYGGSKRFAVNNWSTSSVTEATFKTGWKIAATSGELATKADTTKAQIGKITRDDGGVYVSVSATETFSGWVKNAPMGMHSVYCAANDPSLPYSGSSRILVHKTGNSTDINTWGYGWAVAFWGTEMYFKHFYGLPGSVGALEKDKWYHVSKQQILSGTGAPNNANGVNGDVYIQYI